MAHIEHNTPQFYFAALVLISSFSMVGCNIFSSSNSCDQTEDVSERYNWENLRQLSYQAHISFNDVRTQEEADSFTKSLGFKTLGFWVDGIVVELPCGVDLKNEVLTRYWGADITHETLSDSSFIDYIHPIFLDGNNSRITPTNTVMVAFEIDLDKSVIDSIVTTNDLEYSNFNPGSDLNWYNLILNVSSKRDPIEMGKYLDSLDETRAAQISFIR